MPNLKLLRPGLLLLILIGITTTIFSAATLLAAAPPWASGATNVLVIMVQFPADPADPDGAQPAVNCSFTAAQMQANLFGATATGPGNMADYYNEVSFGALNLNGTVVGCFTVANDKNDYDDGPLGAADLVREAVALADPTVDFSAFDNDGDGAVDNVAIAYAGGGPDNGVYLGANPNDGFNRLWPHASSIAAVAVDGGARTVSQYYMAPELLDITPRIRTIGVYAHEFGHKLGLPDLYDTDDSSNGIGHWDLMGSGSWNSNNPGIQNGEAPAHLSAWSKWFLGWITPTDLTGVSVAQNIQQAETNPVAIQLLANPGGPDDWPGGTGEYFLIENRQQTAFDVGLDGCGILVWHIDEAQTNNASEGHTGASHRLVDLEEADPPPEELDQQPFPGPGNRGDAGDPYLGPSSNAQLNSRLYDGSNTGIQIGVITTGCADPIQVQFGPQTKYEVKYVCGTGDDKILGFGTYTTAINIINRDDATAAPSSYLRSFSVGLPGETAGVVTTPRSRATLAPGDAAEIDCNEIVREVGQCEANLCKGFVTIHSPVPLDIIAVYTAADPATGLVTGLHTEPLIAGAPQCTTTTLSVPAQTRLFVPPHNRGDRDFKGHGPCVRFAVDLGIEDDGTALTANYEMHAFECAGSFTSPQHDFTASLGGRKEQLALAGPNGRILGYSTASSLQHTYIDNDHADDIFNFSGNEPVSSLRFIGDTSGDESGTKTGVFVTFRAMDVRLETCSVPSNAR